MYSLRMISLSSVETQVPLNYKFLYFQLLQNGDLPNKLFNLSNSNGSTNKPSCV